LAEKSGEADFGAINERAKVYQKITDFPPIPSDMFCKKLTQGLLVFSKSLPRPDFSYDICLKALRYPFKQLVNQGRNSSAFSRRTQI